MIKRIALVASLLAAIAGQTVFADHEQGHVDVNQGPLSKRAQFGEKAFNAVCAECHGENGSGTKKGPPLIHPIYNPGHHSNQSIINAIKNGVRQHHWPYGDMPAQDNVSFFETSAIIEFIRETQRNNGIENQGHQM